MEKLCFETLADLADYMFIKSFEGINSTAILFCDDTLKLIKEFMVYDEIEVGYIDIAQIEYDGYDKEYYVTLSEDCILSIEPAWRDNKYLNAEPDLMLVHGDANYSIIKDVPVGKCKEIQIGIDDETKHNCGECCGDCCNCAWFNDNDERVVNDKSIILMDIIDFLCS